MAAAKHSTRYTRAATSYSAAAAVGPELHFFIPFLLSTSTTKRTLRTALRGPTDRPLPSSTRTLNGKLTHMLSYSSSSRGRANERKKAACACAPFYARCKPVGGSGVRHYTSTYYNVRRHRPKHCRHFRATHRVIRSCWPFFDIILSILFKTKNRGRTK